MRLLVLHNPSAGEGAPGQAELAQLFRRHGHEPVQIVSSAGDLDASLREAFDLFVAIGGDGTVAKVGRKALKRPAPVAVLPYGTANNIATVLGLQDFDTEELVAGWATAEQRPFDIGRVAGPWGSEVFFEGVGVGLFAETMQETETGAAAGVNDIDDVDLQLAAARGVVRHVLDRLRPQQVGLWLDGRDLSNAYLLVEVLNCSRAGPGVRLAPSCAPDDGLLDVVLATDDQRDQVADLLGPRPADGGSALHLERGRRLVLRAPSGAVHVDDEVHPASSDAIEITLDAGALTFLVPRSP